MRAERTDPARPPSQPRQPFPKVPGRAAASAKPVLASRDAAHATTAQALQREQGPVTTSRELQHTRAGHTAAARELQYARAGHATTARELQHARAGHAARAHAPSESRPTTQAAPHDAHERLAQALVQAPAASTASPGGRGEATAPTSRVDSALKLVERIEIFLRSGRPQLELSVGGAFNAEVLLERTGPREVAVTVRGKNGPPPPQELARVREALHQRGLKLSSLTSAAAPRPPSSPAARG